MLYVPIMLSLTTYSKEVIVPISLTLTIATSLPATINHWRKNLVVFALGPALLTGALLGAIMGVLFNLSISKQIFFGIFATVILLIGGRLLYDWKKNARPIELDDVRKLTGGRKTLASFGTLLSGFASGCLGIGGGLVNVPLMQYVLGFRARKAIGTSSLLIIFTGFFGFWSYFVLGTLGSSGLSLVYILWPFAFIGAFLGSRWGLKRLRARVVVLVFILVLFLAAAKMLLGFLSYLI